RARGSCRQHSQEHPLITHLRCTRRPRASSCMSGTGPLLRLSPQDWDAVLFDMDGVLTRTADVHARAWKKLFDNFLARQAQQSGADFTPFDIEVDYRRYVDGKPRYDGVVSF